MALPVYSTRLMGWAASEFAGPFTCPEGYITVVRCADVYTYGGELTNYRLYVNEFATFWGGQFSLLSTPQHDQWQGRQVLLAGDELVFQADGSTDGMVSGYVLAAP